LAWGALAVSVDILLVLSGAGLLYTGHGLVGDFSGREQVLWYEKTGYFGTLTATFVNRNSFATAYAGLVLVGTTGLLLASFDGEGGTERGLRARLHDLLTALLERGQLLILAWVTIALLLTQSRGGFFAGSAGLCVLLGAFALRRGSRPGLALGAAAPILAGRIGLFSLGGEATNARLAGIEGDAAERGRLQAIAERPLTGWGHGSFADVLVRDAEVPQDVVMAHNSDLELALELGVPAAALLVLAFTALFLRCLTSVRVRGRDALVAAHLAIDFSLQIPAVAATYALIVGVAVAQS
jgi:O-antigen ligase